MRQIKMAAAFCCFILTIITASAQQTFSDDYGNNPSAGGYKKVNGMDMYYEIYGTGKPLLFLHGNGGSIKSARAKIEYFRKFFKVIAIDSRAHGRSVNPSAATLTYTQMADDVRVLMDSLGIDSAFISGQSDGGILGLLLAIHYPQKVSRLVTFGANIFPGKKAVFDEIDDMVRDTLKTTKDPHTKQLYGLMVYQPNITEQQLQTIKCPVLIMTGDRDAIRLEHSLKIFYSIPNANLFVMPGASHFGSYQKPELFNKILLDFLNNPFSKLSTVEIMTGKR